MLSLIVAVATNTSRVLVIENTNSPASVEIATDYLKKRSGANLLKVQCQDSAISAANETMQYAEFVEKIDKPLRAYLEKRKGIDFIVLTKGIPIRLVGATTGVSGTQPSLDSTIAAMGYKELKRSIPIQLNDSGFTGKCWSNRFWSSKERFSHSKFGGYLVTRLDGYSVDDAKLLTTFAVQSETTKPAGKILIDVAEGHGIGNESKVPLSAIVDGKLDLQMVNEMAYNEWDADMVVAGKTLEKKGIPVTVDRTDVFVGRKSGLAGYTSWGSNDPKFDAAGYLLLRFEPGAIAETAVSTSARTFLPTQGGQSLIADLIKGRVTGVKGYCDEPLLQAVASPTILFDRYTSGWTLAESFYAASRFVGWEDIVIGDPLCTPYAK
ncbi:MAG TPA: TIGR03790 family protein [Fimbriimonas sp.]|nr:TIGR03790 family protein [Fimbriimonas sp.]